ncbi:MAG: ABC transporter ATP-binding protein/permease [Holosporaceae bacterium]|jgi:subfamily B ATP-binding cassette protein MsbA|nr:ABC transporter ATP-binding protein/permease [Holosporaceae bacterium]
MVKKIIKRIRSFHAIKNYKNIYPYIKPYWFRALMAVLITMPMGMMDIAIPWALKQYIDTISSGGKVSTISVYMPFLIVGFSIMQSAFTYITTYVNSWVGMKISNDLKYDLFKKLMRCEASFFDKNVSGTIQMRFNSDVDTACVGLLNHLRMFFTRIFNSLSLIVVLFIISWRLAIAAVIVLIVALYPLTTIRKRISDVVNQTFFSGAAIATHYIEAFAGNRIVTSYNLYDYQMRKISNALNYAFKLGMKMIQRTGILSPIMHFVIGVGVAVIIWMGSYLISYNLLSAGGFVAFVTSVIMLYQPIKNMGNNFNAVQTSLLAIERVFSILKETPLIANRKNAIPLASIKDKIEYKDVYFAYEKDRPILKKINLTIEVGQTVALVGNSGGGKTTFVNLLPRFYDINSGKILIDGIDIKNLELDSLREKIAIVFQDNFLFSGTIRENILLGRSNATRQEIERVVKLAYLEEVVAELPRGLDTNIGERGVLLSGGQRQRLAIARALIKNADVVILDEATSALDTQSEAIVQKAINNLTKERTVFVIAHRLSTVRNADKIIVLNQGEIVETGTHTDLIKKNGAYTLLHNTHLT